MPPITGAVVVPLPQLNLTEIIVALIAAAGGALTAWFAFRAKQKEDTQTLINQLQEERSGEREERRKERMQFAEQLAAERSEIAAERAEWKAEREENSARMDRMWADKSASRNYVGALERHIWDEKPPPPPEPPEGYIP